jgi:hypothetical protein
MRMPGQLFAKLTTPRIVGIIANMAALLERGKGDHCHLDGKEVAYTFVSVDQLVEDFIKAVAARRTS